MELIFMFTALLVSTTLCLFLQQRRMIELITVIATLIACIETILIALRVATTGTYVAYPIFFVDALGAIVLLIIGLVGLFVSFYSVFYLRKETAKAIIGFRRVKQYFILLQLFLLAMLLAITSNNPIVTWISIEATTLSTVFLISFYNKPSSLEAAWKYLIINSIGLLLGFFGTLLYFTALNTEGVTGGTTWDILLSNAQHLDPLTAQIAFVFVLIGYGTKVGLAPMHTWLPDAHSKAPVPISALLSGVLLNVAFVAVLRFKAITDITIGSAFSQKFLIAFGLLSIVIAVFIILIQKNYKRLLAYSSIENMGMMAVGFGFGGLGIFAALLHMVYHSLVKSALFLSAGNIFLKYSSTKIANVRGAYSALPITSIMFLIGFFAIVGTPPFGIFLTKMLILSAGISIHPLITITTLGMTAILFVGFLKHVIAMIFGEKSAEIKKETENIWLILPPLLLLCIAFYLSFSLPPFLYTLLTEAASHYS